MSQTRLSPQHFFIPLLAFTAVLLIGSTQWGSTFRTLLGFAQTDRSALIELTGVSAPKLDLEVMSWEGGKSLTLTLGGERTKQEAKLTVPAEWQLQEVRGIHIRELTRYTSQLQRTTILFPMKKKITMRFRTDVSFEAITFVHDSDSPALLTLTHITLPAKNVNKTAQIIEDSGLLTL